MRYLTHARAISFAAGLGTAGGLYLTTKRLIWGSEGETVYSLPGAPARLEAQAQQPVFGPVYRAYLVRKWNEAVDAAFTPVITALSKRNL